MTRPCARVLWLSSCLRGQCGSRCGEPGRPGQPTWHPPRPFVDRSYVPCAASVRAAISVRSRLGPNVDGVAGRIQRSELLHRVTPCGPENVHEGTPFVAGLPPRRSPTLGVGAFRRRGTAGFRRAPVLTQVRVHGACGSVLHA